jgi:hypothetical protein
MASGIDCTLGSFQVGQTSCFLATTSAFSFMAVSGIDTLAADMPHPLELAKNSGD